MGSEQFGRGNVWASAKEAGIWRDVPFVAANFNAGNSTWNIVATDVPVNRYTRIGNTIIWVINITNFSALAGSSVNFVSIAIPVKVKGGSYSAMSMGRMHNPSTALVAGVATVGEGITVPSFAHIRISPTPSIPLVAGLLWIAFTSIYEVA